MNTAELLTSFETCQRKGVWSRDWARPRLTPNQLLYRAIQAGVTEAGRTDYGEVAGEAVMDLASNPGMEKPANHHLYESVVHHAALADVLTMAIQRPEAKPWTLPEPRPLKGALWSPSGFVDASGSHLRRIVLATSWNDERHYSEVRSWYGLGEIAMYGLPMKMVVLVLGQHRDGRRSGPWAKGFLHPNNHKLRFRKKSRATHEVFSEKWEQVWREDRGEISTSQWLQAMLEDDILRDVCFTVDIPVPTKPEVQRIREMAVMKLERLRRIDEVPEASMSVCDRPPCVFRGCCWSEKAYEPSEKVGFVRIGCAEPGIVNGMTREQRQSITLQGIADAMADQWGRVASGRT